MINTICPHDATYGEVNVKIEKKDYTLSVEIETLRLKILSVNTDKYLSELIALYGNKKVNQLVGAGETLNATLVKQKIQRWIQRWSEGNPFAGYVVLKKNGEFIGQIIVKPVKDKTDKKTNFIPGVGEIGYLLNELHWRLGYGREFTHAVIYHLLPRLIQEGYSIKEHPLTTLIATTRPDNIASNRILSTFMEYIETKPRYGSDRNWYQHHFNELVVLE